MKLAIVGVGKLGLAILEGVLSRGLLQPADIGIMDTNAARLSMIAERLGTPILPVGELGGAERVLISLQPRVFPEASEWLRQPGTGYISTMAGVSVATLSKRLLTERVVRVMPNLGATIGQSQTAITGLDEAQQSGDMQYAHEVFGSVGQVYDLAEHLFNAFTGMVGSGPGYLAVIADALADGGVRMGLPRALAHELAARLFSTSGGLLLQRAHPAMLKDEVSSPGGTTIAGLEVLESSGVRGAIISTVVAATLRSAELGRDQE
ncbi:pyrroline-5-carboxylate reductase [Deinococcus detaillensis]|uniref:Pyrroline-5-carboxylate reductase n=1 Tax=Deinococcus detaillensis TaxID=2592048 RepID=A0A553V546_9DEIO|nr:pyrroline-5-carboxylate reductase [Deinococcus detaillensis]TSA87341.1 pyrroline-5-carboxylate reductase [Deinococcus detaillensis]